MDDFRNIVNANTEIRRLESQLAAAVKRERILNPCGHTGYESAPCAICGYPDPHNRIAALVERERVLEDELTHYKKSLENCLNEVSAANLLIEVLKHK